MGIVHDLYDSMSLCPSICPLTTSKIISSETSQSVKAKYYVELLWKGEKNVCYMTKIAAIAICGKYPSITSLKGVNNIKCSWQKYNPGCLKRNVILGVRSKRLMYGKSR